MMLSLEQKQRGREMSQVQRNLVREKRKKGNGGGEKRREKW
jgi:hypothetical protein